MELELYRLPSTNQSTEGTMIVDGGISFTTLEDVVRDQKIFGTTAIPEGRYQVIDAWSNKRNRNMPTLVNVPNYSGVQIHVGNKAEDTLGCILIGTYASEDYIFGSQQAFDTFYPMFKAALNRGEECWITIYNGAVVDSTESEQGWVTPQSLTLFSVALVLLLVLFLLRR